MYASRRVAVLPAKTGAERKSYQPESSAETKRLLSANSTSKNPEGKLSHCSSSRRRRSSSNSRSSKQ